MTYFLLPAAEQDIDEIISYTAHENQSAALKLLDALFESMNRLAENPLIGYKREDLTKTPENPFVFGRSNGTTLLSIGTNHLLKLSGC